MNIESSTVKITSLVAVAMFLAGAAYQAGTYFAGLSSQLSRLDEKLTKVEEIIKETKADVWTDGNQAAWCRETEALNEGFRCGHIR